ncbi:MAG TPA: PP2C family serine/threonine-protein phosphatase [Steroidobacteraceae bacterium]|nr:PP2C family serine/threonine-protein phosphatase [Steroidobacteraceae bacterium]
MQIEYAELSLVGHREDNQDRVGIAVGEQAALLVAVDGMGGHSNGALAAETALGSLTGSFRQLSNPLFDPLGFLHLALGKAHDDVVALGKDLSIDQRPRATCALCLIQEGSAFWAHVGDSRVYQIRNGEVIARTRDHSHVEQLLREGRITESEAHGHPMRNFVECCLGGDPLLTEMTIGRRRALKTGDLLLACTDGLWANLDDSDVAAPWRSTASLPQILAELCKRAVRASAPFSDNTSAAVLRWLG